MDSPKIDAIDDIIHGRLRLGVMAYLSAVETASFPELVERTGATNGNLSHASEQAGRCGLCAAGEGV